LDGGRDFIKEAAMTHVQPPLPYPKDALKPHISAETLEFHSGKHHKAYVDNLNKLIAGTEFENMPLEEVIRKSSKGVFNNAAQVWNHTFYFNGMSPKGGGEPSGAMAAAVAKSFGSFAAFKEQFSQTALTTFGSGWAWLVKKPDGSLAMESASNAANPLTGPNKPLLTIDVWEHAYYIDYRNARADYIKAWWNLVDWKGVEKKM
jgi:superoxide dismutase, Fe-Mn family